VSNALDARQGIAPKVFFAFTNPRPGQEDDFELWYSRHLKDITDVDGFLWGERLVADPDQRPGQIIQWRYAAIYGFEGDTNEIHRRLREADAGWGDIPGQDALHPEYNAWVYDRYQPLVVNESRVPDGNLDLAGGLGEHLFIVFTNPTPGREREFEEWYDEHLQAVTDVDGFVWGERLIADPDQRPGQATRWKYVALYGFDGDVVDIHERLRVLGESQASFAVTDAVHPAYVAWVYSSHQPLILHEDAAGTGTGGVES
jgi:antibiotic biosynthesis monooxygenase (ABM) superfamily enzyme